MLSQKFQRKDAETRRRKEKLLNIFASLRLCVFAFLLFFISCKSEPTDLRTLAPAETLVYLETKDLSKTLNALTESKTFQEAAQKKPDFSALENVQFAVAVTGFEASEKQVTAENSVLNFKPHFVAVADTHAWNWQTLSLTENQIGNFVKETYGGDARLEKSDKMGGKWFAWTAKDESKVFAFVEESRIFFGNDAAAIEKCMAVKRGEADSLLKNESLSRAYAANSENNLAFGYVSPEGVAQISSLAGVKIAADSAEEDNMRNYIASIFSEGLKRTTKEIIWNAKKNEIGIEDKIIVNVNSEFADSQILEETIIPTSAGQLQAAEFLPADIYSVTHYNLKNPEIAWNGLWTFLFRGVGARETEDLSEIVKNSLIEPYGISDVRTFLSAVDSDIFTAQFDAEGEKGVVVATVKDAEKLKKSLSEINFKAQPERQSNAEIWQSEDKTLSAAFTENKLILGDAESVLKCLEARQNGQNFTKSAQFQKFAGSNAVAVTSAKDFDSAEKVVEVLSGAKDENKKFITNYLTETRITEKGIERRSISDFGLIGTILEQIGE